MSEAARELLKKKSEGKSIAPESARDALARRASGETFTKAYEPRVTVGRGGPAPSDAVLEKMRNNPAANTVQSFIDDPMASIKAIPPAINRGSIDLLSLPIDTAANAGDLLGMGYGLAAEGLTGRPAGEFFQPTDRANVWGSSDNVSRILDSSPLGPVTQLQDPDNAAARLVYNTARAIPGAASGRAVASSAAGGAAGSIASDISSDPALQAAASMAGGHMAERPGAGPHKSAGAAAAGVDLERLSPELRAAVDDATRKTGGAVNPDVLARQIQADSLPVKVRLSEGQALGDPTLISQEQNSKGKYKAYADGFAQQNKDLVDNVKVLRDQIGPDVFSTNPVEHADTIINRYKTIDDAARSEISSKYKKLEEANGGQFPVNGDAFINAADAALAKKMKGRYLPKEVRGDIEEFRDNAGFMTFEQFENLRTNLATEARKAERSGDGNAAAAVNIVRRELEALPMSAENAQLKALADDARKAAKARFDALDADPAYKAAVNDSVTPDSFVQKFIVNGARDNVSLLNEAMKGDDQAYQTVKVATLDHLRKSAGIDPGYNGNFSQAGYNKALQGLEPKLLSLLDAKTAETVRNLGDVARYTQVQPRGSFVNNSNTFTAAAGHVEDVLEKVTNAKAGGIPIGTWMRQNITDRNAAKRAEESFKPGAGLTKLSDLAKVGKEKK